MKLAELEKSFTSITQEQKQLVHAMSDFYSQFTIALDIYMGGYLDE